MKTKHLQKKPWHIISIMIVVLVTITSHKSVAQTNEATLDVYLPIETAESPMLSAQLTAFLSQSLKQKVTVHTSELWHDYQQKIRDGEHNIVFSSPHFSAWNIHYNDFRPLLKLSQPLNYVLVTRSKDTTIFELSDLTNKRVCMQQPINLDYLLLQSQFTNSISTPTIEFTTQAIQALIKDQTECRAFMVVEAIFEQLPQHTQNLWTKLYQSQIYSNYAWLAHPKIPQTITQKFQAAISSSKGIEIIQPLIQRYATKANLTTVKSTDYPITYTQLLQKYWQ